MSKRANRHNLRTRLSYLPGLGGLRAAATPLMALLYAPEADPSRVYYGTDTWAGGLLIGAALALIAAALDR